MLYIKRNLAALAAWCLLFVIYSCSSKQEIVAVSPARLDSLKIAWDNAWNNRDAEAIKNQFDNHAVVFENAWIVRGIDSLQNGFIAPNSAAIKSFRTEMITGGSSDSLAYLIGNYFIETNREPADTIVGPFTLIWKKQDDNTWKVISLQTGTR